MIKCSMAESTSSWSMEDQMEKLLEMMETVLKSQQNMAKNLEEKIVNNYRNLEEKIDGKIAEVYGQTPEEIMQSTEVKLTAIDEKTEDNAAMEAQKKLDEKITTVNRKLDKKMGEKITEMDAILKMREINMTIEEAMVEEIIEGDSSHPTVEEIEQMVFEDMHFKIEDTNGSKKGILGNNFDAFVEALDDFPKLKLGKNFEKLEVIGIRMKSNKKLGKSWVENATGFTGGTIFARKYWAPYEIIRLCVKKRSPGAAIWCLQIFPQVDIVLCTVMIEFGKKRDLALDVYRIARHSESRGNLKLDVFTYSTMIKVLADARRWKMALEIKEDMLLDGDIPNSVTWLSLISACANAGLAEQAIQLFDEMLQVGCETNSQCCNIVLHACVEARQYNRVSLVFHSWKENGIIIGKQGLIWELTETVNWTVEGVHRNWVELVIAFKRDIVGSVKIWKAYASEVMKPSDTNCLPFYLLKEIVTIDSGMVSVLPLIMPLETPEEIHLAIGRGSGSLEVWIGDLDSCKFEKESCSNAHEHILTRLAWAFGGNRLYSCSQDGTIRSWILQQSILSEVPFPSNILGVRSPSDVPDVYDLCFGFAISPGNLAMAVVHSFESCLLNPMYEARIQKAVVEFLWIGGQQLDLILNNEVEFEGEETELSKREQTTWEHNILWSLKQYECRDKALVIWDIVAALSAFGQSILDYLANIIFQWMNYLTNIIFQWMKSLFGSKFEVLPPISCEIAELLSNITSRQLHILNVIGRRVFLKKLKADQTNSKEQDFKQLDGAEEQQNFWLKLVGESEKELREGLVCVTLIPCDYNPQFFHYLRANFSILEDKNHFNRRVFVMNQPSKRNFGIVSLIQFSKLLISNSVRIS